MQDSLHIHRFQARHHVPDAAARRLAQDAQAQLLDGELEAALASVAAPDEVLLLRRLSARVRLSHHGTERDNARAWGDALALSLTLALQHAGPQDLLRFASPQQALQAFAADVLLGNGSRDWAWQRLGWLPATGGGTRSAAQRRRALLRLLADDEEQGVPLLRGLLAGGLWPTLVAQLHEDELRGLVQVVLTRLAGPAAGGFDRAAPQPAPSALPGLAHGPESEPGAAMREAPAWFMPTLMAAAGEAAAQWALRLAAMLSQPALARRGAAAVDGQLAAWLGAARAAGRLAAAARAEAQAASARRPAADAMATSAATSAVTPATRPGAVTPAQGQEGEQAAPAAQARERGATSSAGADEADEAAAVTTAQIQPIAPPDPAMPTGIEPQFGATQHGGLLLLAPLLPLCGALPLLEDPVLWPELPQALHQLALQLWPLAPDDPAALAFCGLPPPKPLQPPALPRPLPPPQPTPAQQAALQTAQALLLAHLDQRLPDWRGPGLLARVVCRPARISADPGWIEVVFPLRDVAIELRRAALDLDPGFLPWLGVVLRYRYE